MRRRFEIIYTRVATDRRSVTVSQSVNQEAQVAASECPEGAEAKWPLAEPG